MGFQALPKEINEKWIDCLRVDHAALKACSLACRRLNPLAQPYLFEHVKVQSAPRWLRFLRILRRSTEVGTDIGQYIRKLEFTDISIGSSAHDLFLDIVREASRLSSTLINVQKLVLREWDWVTIADRALDYDPVSAARHVLSTLLPFPRLHSIALVNNVVRYPHIIPELLTTLPSLTTLHIESLRFSDDALYRAHIPFQHDITVITSITLQDVSVCYDPDHAAAADFILRALLVQPPFNLESVHTFRIEGPLGPSGWRTDEVLRQPVRDVLVNINHTCEHLHTTSFKVGGLALRCFSRLKSMVLQWDTPLHPHNGALDNVAFISKEIQRLVTPGSTDVTLDEIEIRFPLGILYSIMKEPYILDDLDTSLVLLHIYCPAMTLRFRFFIVPSGAPSPTPDIISLLRPVVQRVVSNGLQLKVTTITTVHESDSGQPIVEETNLSSL